MQTATVTRSSPRRRRHGCRGNVSEEYSSSELLPLVSTDDMVWGERSGRDEEEEEPKVGEMWVVVAVVVSMCKVVVEKETVGGGARTVRSLIPIDRSSVARREGCDGRACGWLSEAP